VLADYVKPVTHRLNPTGKTISMSVPLRDGERALGEIAVRIGTDDAVRVSASVIAERLKGVIAAATLERIGVRAQGGDIALSELAAEGVDLAFDSAALELTLKQGADGREVGEISLARSIYDSDVAPASAPADVSGYVNVFAGVDHAWQSGRTGLHLELQSVIRVRGAVFENDLSIDGAVDRFECPFEAACVYGHEAGFKRRRSRVVYDLPEQEIRLQAGDVGFGGIGTQQTPDLLGVSIEHSARKLAPGRILSPTGQSALRLDLPAEVDVVMNGSVVRRLRLAPGTHNLRDLPLAAGVNDLELVITDATGQRRVPILKTYLDAQMLGTGKTEWSIAAGVPSYMVDGGRRYRTGDAFASAFLRYGVSDGLTAEAHAQADEVVRMGGVGAITATAWGSFGLEVAASSAIGRTGYAAGINWTLASFRGTLAEHLGGPESLRLYADYRSSSFRTPGDRLIAASGILYPQYPYRLRVGGSYTVPIDSRTTAILSARYQVADREQFSISPLTFRSDRYGVDLTLSRELAPGLSAALTVGYGNESYLRDLAGTPRDDPELRAMVRFHWRPEANSFLAASYDTLDRLSRVSGYRADGQGVGRWESSVDVQQSDRTDRTSASANVTYFANRAEVQARHGSSFRGGLWDGFSSDTDGQRSSLTVGTAIAFAGDRVAVGSPVRGDAFAIVTPHESLEAREITLGTRDDVRARSDGRGPLLVSNIPVYARHAIPFDVDDLPVGYSLGAGAFDLRAPYKAGYALEVGSGYSVSVYGTLVGVGGAPAGLVSGEAVPVGAAGPRVEFFTNSAGRFGADGLAPGRWRLTLATEGTPTVYEIEIPPGTRGLHKAGAIMPVTP
jgi:outer membrane usher protein